MLAYCTVAQGLYSFLTPNREEMLYLWGYLTWDFKWKGCGEQWQISHCIRASRGPSATAEPRVQCRKYHLRRWYSCSDVMSRGPQSQSTVEWGDCYLRMIWSARSAALSSLIVRHNRLFSVDDRAFPVAATLIWNSLSQHFTSASSLPVFIARLMTHLFSLSFSWL